MSTRRSPKPPGARLSCRSAAQSRASAVSGNVFSNSFAVILSESMYVSGFQYSSLQKLKYEADRRSSTSKTEREMSKVTPRRRVRPRSSFFLLRPSLGQVLAYLKILLNSGCFHHLLRGIKIHETIHVSALGGSHPWIELNPVTRSIYSYITGRIIIGESPD